MTVSPEEVMLLARLEDHVSRGVRAAMAGVPESAEARMSIASCLLSLAVVWARSCGVTREAMSEFLGVAWDVVERAPRRPS